MLPETVPNDFVPLPAQPVNAAASAVEQTKNIIAFFIFASLICK